MNDHPPQHRRSPQPTPEPSRVGESPFRPSPRFRGRALAPGRAVLAALSSILLAAPASAALRVALVSPAAGYPAFGTVELIADVRADAAVVAVDFFVDGARAGRLAQPPYRLTFDVGDANVGHHFRVVVTDATGASAEHAVETPNIPVDMAMDVELQQLFVSVAGSQGPVTGLTQEAFTVLNDRGRPESVATFGAGDLPISAVLLLDSSESMKGEPLAAALAGVRSFVDRTKPEDETMVAFFSDHLIAATSFAKGDAALGRALGDLQAAGGSAVFDHLYYALNRLQPRLGRRVVVLLSDGLDVSSFLDMEQVLWRARRSQAMVYWLRLATGATSQFASSWRSGEASKTNYELLEKAVDESGGRILEIRNVEEIDVAFRRVIDEIRQQYVLGYQPRDARNDGSWRALQVKVKGGYTVRTRAGFID
jgi:Ca-activated chloride channel family protein